MEGVRSGRARRVNLVIGALTASLLLVAGVASAAPSGEAYEVARAPAKAPDAFFAVDEDLWRDARRISWGPPKHATTFRALWNDAGLWVRFDAVDSDPWYTLRARDDKVWTEEAVELFMARDQAVPRYTEIQISPGNVLCDLAVDLSSRRFDLAWNLRGLESRVRLLRDRAGRTVGWTAIAFLPWSGLASASSTIEAAQPPRAGDRWRFNVFRIERPGGPVQPERDALYFAWSPTGQRSFHVWEAFRELLFL